MAAAVLAFAREGANVAIADVSEQGIQKHRRSRHWRPHARTPARLLDRKSTRLNSSHASTSYAVFCLRKKTPTTPRGTTPRSATRARRERETERSASWAPPPPPRRTRRGFRRKQPRRSRKARSSREGI